MMDFGLEKLRLKIPYKAGLPFPKDKEIAKLRSVQLDISTGVDLEHFSKRSVLDSTLDIFQNIDWNIYPLEFICAEKIHCLYAKGDLNTRGKDVYDLSILLPQVKKNKLKQALKETFKNRGDELKLLKSLIENIDTSYLSENFTKSLDRLDIDDFKEAWDEILKYIL
jgi:predicted nucleotidyltransferase component of viral defense system